VTQLVLTPRMHQPPRKGQGRKEDGPHGDRSLLTTSRGGTPKNLKGGGDGNGKASRFDYAIPRKSGGGLLLARKILNTCEVQVFGKTADHERKAHSGING